MSQKWGLFKFDECRPDATSYFVTEVGDVDIKVFEHNQDCECLELFDDEALAITARNANELVEWVLHS